jgi:organic hydroperoxide reductase OsmC/OhrA
MAPPPAATFHSHVRWVGSYVTATLGPRSYGRDTIIDPEGKPPIPGSAGARYFGDDSRYNPEDLMLASLAECHLLTYLALTTKAGIRLVSLSVGASGELGSIDGKVRFREATVAPVTEVESAGDLERARALHQAAHEQCFMSNSVNFPVRVEATVTSAARGPDPAE